MPLHDGYCRPKHDSGATASHPLRSAVWVQKEQSVLNPCHMPFFHQVHGESGKTLPGNATTRPSGKIPDLVCGKAMILRESRDRKRPARALPRSVMRKPFHLLVGLLPLAAFGCSGDVNSGSSPSSADSPYSADSASNGVPEGSPNPALPPDGDVDGDGIINVNDPDTMASVTPVGTTPIGTPPVVIPPTTPGEFEPNVKGEPIHAHLVRLTHPQWENTIRDLLQLDAVPGLSQSFEGDPPRGKFANNEKSLEVTSTLWGDYRRAAETLAEQVANDDQAREAIVAGADAATFIRNFGLRAFRRPLSAEEEQTYGTLYQEAATYFPEKSADVGGFQLIVETMLQSPHFLYRSEMGADGEALNSYEVASKLSFLLRNTTPNDELLDAAANNQLSTPTAVLTLAQQMLSESSITEVIQSFDTTAFGTDRYSNIVKDNEVFPSFQSDVSADLQTEANLFLSYIFTENLSVRDLLTSTTGFVTARTADLYGVAAPSEDFAAVDLGAGRPGFFTRAGFLALNGTNTQSDPIHRGVELNERMLCVELTAPPGELPQLPPFEPNQTNRQRVAAHTEMEGSACVTCHGTFINPLGFAFESFDSVGQVRATDNGQPVETAATYPFADGAKSFAGATELMAVLAASPQVHACYSEQIAEFTLGRDLEAADLGLVNSLLDQSQSDTSIKDLMLAVVQSDAFLKRTGVTQ
jgi:hypothetical protein